MSYTYDSASGRYRDATTGRFIANQAVRDAVDAVVDAGTTQIVALTRQLQAGTLDLATWQLDAMNIIKVEHVAAGIAAHGGREHMAPADYGWIGSRIKEQYAYLRNFAEEIASGQQALDGRLLVRAELYGQAARGTYEELRRRDQRARAVDHERRIRHSSDSCTTCVEQAAKGWQPLGTLNTIGQSECRTRCRCTFDYRRQPLAEAA